MEKYFEVNEQGNNIRCKLYYRDRPVAERAVLFCTGFAGHKDNNAACKFAEKALSKEKNLIVAVFDWPAHGDDVKKKLSLADCSTYLELVVRALKTDFGVQRLFCYATSFGGYVVLNYISTHENPFEKIALRCPAVNMYEVLTRTIMKNDELERIRRGKDVLVGFDRKITVTCAFLEELKENDVRQRDFLDDAENLLMLQGTEDEVVPFADSAAFSDAQIIELIPVEGADHRFQNPLHMSLANKRVMEFFNA